ncbi:MAG TPA: penicillin acylase family protein [Saprospiraceae bacterium]|nr:penicillin acylase family protein [Saprospiraceae bacterium]
MRFLKILLPILLSWGWITLMTRSIKVGETNLPPLGNFICPSTGFWQNVFSAGKNAKTMDVLSNVDGKIHLDDRAVPHIFAGSLKDAFFLQGYMHAYHRLWQMDFATLAAEGRVSEVAGVRALDFDKIKRRKGLAESARKSIEVWKTFPESFALVEAYTAGVNFYIDHLLPQNYPIEYKLMNDAPRRWSPYRSALFHKSMAEILCGREQDIELSNAQLVFGQDFDLLFPENNPEMEPVIPPTKDWGFKMENLGLEKSNPKEDMGYLDIQREHQPSGLGSNNWAVNAAKSTTGNPILCNDPHLTLTLPCIWYEQQIVTPEMNVYGVTFPGIPGVVIGFNNDIAWGVTNAGWDVMDWYRIQWKDETHHEYLLDGEWKQVNTRYDTIRIKNENFIIDTVKLTDWGPVVYEHMNNPKEGLSMHWIIHEPSTVCELDAFVGLGKGKNYNDYRAAIRKFPYPAQNMAFISKSNDIALTVQGLMPIKSNQLGRFVLDGTKSEHSWNGFLPLEFNPHCLNPARGFISSANQKSTDATYPNYYNDGDFRSYRGNMVNRLLREKEKWSVEDMMSLQHNAHSLKAESILPLMLEKMDSVQTDAKAQSVIAALKKWNYNYDSNSVEAVYFDIWFDAIHQMIWDEVTMDTTKKATAIPSDETTVALMKNKPLLSYYDIQSSKDTEQLKDLVAICFDSMMTKISATEMKNKNWGDYKASIIPHMAKIQAFGIPFISTSGGKEIINAHAKTFGPSWRMIVELTPSGPKAFGVYPGGQDGRPGNPNYKNMIEDWARGKYYLLNYLVDDQDKRISSFSTLEFKKK